MQLPLRLWTSKPVQTIEAVAIVEPERPERSQSRDPDARAAEQARRVELPSCRVHIADVVEQIRVERLVHAESEFGRGREEGLAERRSRGVEVVGVGDVAVRRDGELIIAAKLFSVLHAAQRELLREEEWSGIAGHDAGAPGQPEHEFHRLGSSRLAANLTKRRVGASFCGVALEVELTE